MTVNYFIEVPAQTALDAGLSPNSISNALSQSGSTSITQAVLSDAEALGLPSTFSVSGVSAPAPQDRDWAARYTAYSNDDVRVSLICCVVRIMSCAWLKVRVG